MPGAGSYEQQAQIGVLVALRFSFLFCGKGFFLEISSFVGCGQSVILYRAVRQKALSGIYFLLI